MKLVLQRVSKAQVDVDGQTVGSIAQGWLALLGVKTGDGPADIAYLIDKLMNLRAFNDPSGKMNLSAMDIRGELLIVSQFTLYADCRKGRRPGFSGAAPPQLAEDLYNQFILNARLSGLKVATGQFGADMKVSLVNDGPVTFILDSKPA